MTTRFQFKIAATDGKVLCEATDHGEAYRLPEAMRAMPELHHPVRTSWRLRDIRACLSMYLWDPEQDRMLTYAEARARGL